MNAFTPGPWAVWKYDDKFVISCTSQGGVRHPNDGLHTALAYSEANARLIAAAPDLHAACQALIAGHPDAELLAIKALMKARGDA